MKLIRGAIVTMNPARWVIEDGAVLIDGAEIAAVDEFATLRALHPNTVVVGSATDLVAPGYINSHQHLTGDRLIQSSIPDDLPPGDSIFKWSVPVHAEHSGDDDELAATLTLAESLLNGITSTFEAGTVAHPERVVAAARRVGARLTIGSWGWDVVDGPFAGTPDEVIERQCDSLALRDGGLIDAWVTLVGHDLMSDELFLRASELAKTQGVGLTFHLSPSTSDTAAYLARTGRAPLVHLNEVGGLGSHVKIAHGVHLDDDEVEIVLESGAAVLACPWAYLRLGQGTSQSFRHLDLWRAGGALALGCDAENAGDMVDGLRTAALFAGLAKDTTMDPTVFGAVDALELLTIGGARALGVSSTVGSIEVGKQADLVVHDRTRIEWIPRSDDPVLQLVWGSDGRSVRDVYVAGNQVVRDGEVTSISLDDLAVEAQEAGRSLRRRAGLPTE
ncbi:amidohydrolase family protein [Acidimicrobiales bacterium]|nr:amidohydrolase family protein [Acidimicrobiales bacterium]